MAGFERITKLEAGMPILVGGDRIAYVSADLAEKYKPGDQLIILRETGDILLIPKEIHDLVTSAVDKALEAFEALRLVSDEQITQFYTNFAERLADDATWAKIAQANEADVARAKEKGRSTTRLVADEKMRRNMIAGLQQWHDLPSGRERVIRTYQHEGWKLDEVQSPCGVVAFVFEGRPNVLADATGVLRTGNTAVFRIGSDALGTAQAMMETAVKPALVSAGLPEHSAILLESAEHSAGWALFADSRLALVVARGSGRATEVLGAIARQAGNVASLHGTGGAWIITDETADPEKFELAVYNSIDRKVCNTLNVVCIHRSRAADLVESMLNALKKRSEKLGHGYRIHVVEESKNFIPKELFETETEVLRADGIHREPIATILPQNKLGHEWEWEQTPEVTVTIISDLAEGIQLFNEQSPLMVASLISEDPAAHERFFAEINAPFVGNGFTRWVDGQYALKRPELGISNWQNGRLLARSGILTGDGVYTIRLRVHQTDPDVHR
ncbi:MAG: aldehyde dehydrogenase family protein [Armatimonadota bacterium]|nr:aldehyde dehydrogenase family protein [Armatimonadota bacterium]